MLSSDQQQITVAAIELATIEMAPPKTMNYNHYTVIQFHLYEAYNIEYYIDLLCDVFVIISPLHLCKLDEQNRNAFHFKLKGFIARAVRIRVFFSIYFTQSI